MNDPHVESLTYRIYKRDTVDFDKAEPRVINGQGFTITINDYKAVATMTDHFASVEEAHAAVEPVLERWQFWDDLHERNELRFELVDHKTIDRKPTPGAYHIAAGTGYFKLSAELEMEGHVSRGTWPEPPPDIMLSPDALTLRDRWIRYHEGRETLLSAANFALTVVLANGPGRRNAATNYNIQEKVLSKLGELAANRGGNEEARKADGRGRPLSSSERSWIDAAFKALVIRVAEQAHHGGPPPTPLTMKNLPDL
jgi:hypothetical protein